MNSYTQVTGAFLLKGVLLATCYSGLGSGLNNPAKETIGSLGPIPKGEWEIVRWDDHHADKGPCVAVLRPVGHDAHGRSNFLIHGDNGEGNHTASHGCIIMNHDARLKLRAAMPAGSRFTVL